MVPGKAADVIAPHAFQAAELAGHDDVIGHGYLDAIKVGDIGKIDAKAPAKASRPAPTTSRAPPEGRPSRGRWALWLSAAA
jgi:hypothetical protein